MTPPTDRCSHRTLRWWVVAFVFLLIALRTALQPLTLILAVTCCLWRFWAIQHPMRLPGRQWMSVLTLACLVPATLFLVPLGLQILLANLLVLTASLKFLESRRPEDLQHLSLLGYFLGGVALLFDQSIPQTVLVGMGALMLSGGLMALQMPGKAWTHQLRIAAQLLIGSLPLLVALFLLAPRLPPLWSLPAPGQASTGLSDSVRPGDIAKLSLSQALAFRARFEGPRPNQQDLYWRAIVHEQFDGQGWLNHPMRSSLEQVVVLPSQGTGQAYEVIAEPSVQRWLFSLTPSRPLSDGLRIHSDYTIDSATPLYQQLAYQAEYYPSFPVSRGLAALERAINLEYPRGVNPRTEALAAELRQRYPTPSERVQAGLAWIKQRPFRYTLQPPLLGAAPIDDFLFKTQAGFCEHFASSFSALMRAAGVPARVISGYQGGEYNTSGGHFSVRQADAHAWSEVWLPKQGWIRVDPTALVAPDRIEQGLADALDQPDQQLLAAANLATPLQRLPGIVQLQQLAAAIDFRWTTWVLNYGTAQQQAWLQKLFGQTSALLQASVLMGSILVIGGGVVVLLRLRDRPLATDPTLQRYQHILRWLDRRGYGRQPTETPTDYAQRVGAMMPLLAEPLQVITHLYLQGRYSRTHNMANHHAAQRLHQEFRRLRRLPISSPSAGTPNR
jgi:protein-glutamine gamma-glutamyltransferase